MQEITTKSQPVRSVSRIGGVLLVLALGVFIGRYVVPATLDGAAPYRLLSTENGERQFAFPTFWNAWDALHGNFIGDLDDRNLFYGAVEGMVRATGDPYTVFSTPEDSKQFQENLKGKFSGVGVEIGVKDGLVTVITPLQDSPADQAGIEPEDIIVGVDDLTITSGTSIDEVVQHIRGEKGQEVKLTVIRPGENETREVTIVRDTIEVKSIESRMEEGDVGYVAIKSFGGETVLQFKQAARQLSGSGAKAIIVDVRNNPGGFLQSAVDISSNFLSPGTLVVSEKGKTDSPYRTKDQPQFSQIPVVVLINSGSASASEILAGALQEQIDATIIGTKSYGKGSVQELIPFSDGSSLRVTVAKWYTPNGRSIQDEGIVPDIEVEDDRETEEDEVLQRALEELKIKIVQS
ncbi:MAG: S41 family peptidase [Candidatus Andersenbacteria bacterium]